MNFLDSSLAVGLVLSVGAKVCPAQEPTLSHTALAKETALAAPISLQATQMPLAELLAELQKQSGVTLTLAPDAPTVRVTARLKQMPLLEVMNALSRMYGVTWAKSEAKAYRLQAGEISDLQRQLLQTGNGQSQTLLWEWQLRQEEQHKFADAVVEEAGILDLETPAGVPLSSLSPETQAKVRQQVESSLAPFFLTGQSKLLALRNGPWTLHLVPHTSTTRGTVTTSAPNISLLAPDGSVLSELLIPLLPPQTDTTKFTAERAAQ